MLYLSQINKLLQRISGKLQKSRAGIPAGHSELFYEVANADEFMQNVRLGEKRPVLLSKQVTLKYTKFI